MLAEEYDEPFRAASGGPDPARRAVSGRLTGLADHRWARGAAAALVSVLAGGFVLMAVTSERRSARKAGPAAQATAPVMAFEQPWIRESGACGSQRYLPKVTAAPLRARTGVRVQVGGQSVHTADLDARSLTAAPGLALSSQQFVSQLVPGKDASYALVQTCESTDTSSVLRVSRDSSYLVLESGRHIDSLFADGHGGVWAAEVDAIATDKPITLVQLPGPGVVRLPTGLTPIAVWGTKLIGLTSAVTERSSPSSGTLVSYDLASRRIGPRIGQASSLTVTDGLLLWIDEPCSATAACSLHRYDLATGASAVRDYVLPVETTIVDGVISPDRTQLAFPLPQIYEGQRTDTEGFGPPLNVAVLHLDTGVLERIGGLTLPPTEEPGLTFSARGNWLVMALNQGRRTELLVWQTGQPRPLRPELRVEDLMLQMPPVLALVP